MKVKFLILTVLLAIINFNINCAALITHQEVSPLEFINAANAGDIEKVKKIIQAGIDVNIKDENGYTALLKVTYNSRTNSKHYEVVKLLISAGADVNGKCPFNGTALHNAVRWDNTELCKLLINEGADLHIRDENGSPALFSALWFGYINMISLFLSEGYNNLEELISKNKSLKKIMPWTCMIWHSRYSKINKLIEDEPARRKILKESLYNKFPSEIANLINTYLPNYDLKS